MVDGVWHEVILHIHGFGILSEIHCQVINLFPDICFMKLYIKLKFISTYRHAYYKTYQCILLFKKTSSSAFFSSLFMLVPSLTRDLAVLITMHCLYRFDLV